MWFINSTEIVLLQGDITDSESDAIVNAANTGLILGAGVAGAIKKKGGPLIQEECNEIGKIELGEAVITTGGNLVAKYVIHAASMHLGGQTREDPLKYSIWNSLKIGAEKRIESIAFPAIGTGIAGFPLDQCAEIMLNVFKNFLQNEEHDYKEISIVLFTDTDFKVFKDIFTNRFT
ncbi:MAG: macro domain-containing protein [Candidatus Heimdallarchaeaceae archaeon]|jgi:O-acetyl-ADP-ribose deacetylase (regulator of RNase III)